MKIFIKIFLWFWFGVACIAGIVFFVNWSTQREPFQGRAQSSFTNQMNIYSQMAKRIYEEGNQREIAEFLEDLKISEQIKDTCLVKTVEQKCFDSDSNFRVKTLIQNAFTQDKPQFLFFRPDENFVAKKISPANGESLVLALQFQSLPPPIPFGVDWYSRIFRILAIILTAGLLCYALTRYLITPVLKVSKATQKLAEGDLTTRIRLNRRDELGELARDFDLMAEQIEALIGSQKRLTRDISHELRSPLARMNVALEIAKQKSNPETAPVLERIETESKRLNDMISQILTLSKLETRTEKVEKREINLRKIVEQVVADAEFEAAGKNKSVKLVRTDEAHLIGNERLLRSAIENVVRNAIRYTNAETAVEVSLEKIGNEAVIKTKDYGEGVPENELKDMFKPFYRIAEARERKSGGIGLGLAITEQAVHAHDGKISARNKENGLEIEIRLPLNAAHQQKI